MTQETIPYASHATRPLSARDIFGIIERTLGLLIILYGLYCCCYEIYMFAMSIPQAPGRSHAGLLLFAAFYLVIGGALLRGSWPVRLAYGGKPHN